MVRWLVWLNAYIPLVIVIAFFDRHTHVLAPFYLFRPSGLILLLSLLVLLQHVVKSVAPSFGATLAILGLMLVPIMPNLALKTRDLLTEQGQNRMIFSLTPDQAELLHGSRPIPPRTTRSFWNLPLFQGQSVKACRHWGGLSA